MIDFEKVGQKISYYRKASKMTQDELADRLFITRQALSKWELGQSAPSIDSLIDLAVIFNTSFEDLLCLDIKQDKYDETNIFKGHDRNFILKKIIHNDIDVKIPNIFYQLSNEERLYVLRAIKEGILILSDEDFDDLYVKLTFMEQKYLGGIIK